MILKCKFEYLKIHLFVIETGKFYKIMVFWIRNVKKIQKTEYIYWHINIKLLLYKMEVAICLYLTIKQI